MASNLKQHFGVWLGSTAALLATVSAFLTLAPFTPAIVTTVFTIPVGIAAISLSAWRVGVLALYWAVVAIMAFPNVIPKQFEVVFLLAYPLGVIFGVALFIHYRKSRVTSSSAT
jgi:hypothetical protein